MSDRNLILLTIRALTVRFNKTGRAICPAKNLKEPVAEESAPAEAAVKAAALTAATVKAAPVKPTKLERKKAHNYTSIIYGGYTSIRLTPGVCDIPPAFFKCI